MKFLAFEDELTEDQKKNTQAWVDALRSKDFKQAQKMLFNGNDSYCCLGVACEIQEIPKESLIHYRFPDGASSSVAPPSDWFEETYGWKIDQGFFDKKGNLNVVSLYQINDDWEWTFEQIADLIETVYLKRQDFNA